MTIDGDTELAEQLALAIPDWQLDAVAHRDEHAIEVELPFLHRLAPKTRVVGVALGGCGLDRCHNFATGLAKVLRDRSDEVLIVISSDMNHFASDEENRRLDALAMDALETLDPEHVFAVVRDNEISMCGRLPAVIALTALNELEPLSTSKRVAYATSADVTGDTRRVVGYAGMLFR
jgi:AmmeMemoRadiSam system protein B